MSQDSRIRIEENIRLHNRVADTYEKNHGEIYNPIEQGRLREKLAQALSLVAPSVPPSGSAPAALDFGCGAGNLTDHLLSLGCRVTSADVSPRFLELIRSKHAATGRSETLLLNGRDLTGVPDGRFDLAATYSVLHHVPDYLGAVAEMARVVRSGGVVYLDHEVNEGYWHPSPELQEFRKFVEPPPHWTRYLRPSTYIAKVRLRLNPRYQEEGDIHVFPDDHIEWDRIEALLRDRGFEILLREDYLLYRSHYPDALYQAYRGRCADMRLLVARRG